MNCPARLSRSCGFSYVEVIIATLLVAVSLVPALEALQSGIAAAREHQNYTALRYRTQSLFEQVLSRPFEELEAEAKAVNDPGTATAYSDSTGDDRRLVYLSNYDGDNADGDDDGFTGVDDDLLWVKIEIQGVALTFETLISRQ